MGEIAPDRINFWVFQGALVLVFAGGLECFAGLDSRELGAAII